MSRESIIANGRAFAEQGMTDTLLITREAESAELNPETGQYEPTTTTIYDGPGLIKATEGAGSRVDEAGRDVVLSDYEVRLPVLGTGGITKDDIVTVMASQMDPEMVGTEFRIAGPYWRTFSTQRRFRAEVES